jgi:hypothetical protein
MVVSFASVNIMEHVWISVLVCFCLCSTNANMHVLLVSIYLCSINAETKRYKSFFLSFIMTIEEWHNLKINIKQYTITAK